MELGSIFLILALMVLVGLFISRPLLVKDGSSQDHVINQVDHESSFLQAERDRILSALQELDLDNAMGKVPQESYPKQRSFLLMRGAEVLRRLDSLSEAAQPQRERAFEEAAIEASKGGAGAAFVSDDDNLEIMLAKRRRTRREKSVGFCPKCGSPVQKSDLYCPKCGARVG